MFAFLNSESKFSASRLKSRTFQIIGFPLGGWSLTFWFSPWMDAFDRNRSVCVRSTRGFFPLPFSVWYVVLYNHSSRDGADVSMCSLRTDYGSTWKTLSLLWSSRIERVWPLFTFHGSLHGIIINNHACIKVDRGVPLFRFMI